MKLIFKIYHSPETVLYSSKKCPMTLNLVSTEKTLIRIINDSLIFCDDTCYFKEMQLKFHVINKTKFLSLAGWPTAGNKVSLRCCLLKAQITTKILWYISM